MAEPDAELVMGKNYAGNGKTTLPLICYIYPLISSNLFLKIIIKRSYIVVTQESCVSLRMGVVLMLNRWLDLATDLSTLVAMVRHDESWN